MLRILLIIALPTLALLGCPLASLAQDDASWPHYDVDDYYRGTGFYFSWTKLAVIWLVFLLWVKSTDWVHRDGQVVRTRLKLWLPILLITFAASLGLFWVLANFSLGLTTMVFAYAVPFATYVVVRNKSVQPEQRVFTPGHLGDWFSDRLESIGIGTGSDRDDSAVPQHAVRLHARCGQNAAANEAISGGVRTMPGYDLLGKLLTDVLAHDAAAVMMEFTGEQVMLRYMIDGVWHNVPSQPQQGFEPILSVIRTLTTGDPTGQRAVAHGDFDFELHERAYICQATQQNNAGALRAILRLDTPDVSFDSLEELGMPLKMAERMRQRIGQKNELILFSALPGGGLSTTIDTVLQSTDRIRRDCTILESASKYEREIDATEIHKYSAKITPPQILTQVLRSWPDLLVVRDLKDVETARILCRQSREECLVISTLGAKSAVEVLLRVLMLKVPAKEFADAISCVVHQRLIRRLCNDCKQPYEPSDELLQNLGLPGDRVKTLYRAPQSPAEPCRTCRGIGYQGRTAIFETLVVDDAMRDLLTTKPSLEGLTTLAVQAGMHTVREFGAVLVARGETSVDELSRVLKQ